MAVGPIYLIDKSAWEQRGQHERARARLRELAGRDQLAVCVVTVAELLYSARNATELAKLRLDLAALPYLELGPEGEQQVPTIMTALAMRGHHRIPIPDLLVAAAACQHNAVVLHHDPHYEHIAEVTGQAHEWIIPPAPATLS